MTPGTTADRWHAMTLHLAGSPPPPPPPIPGRVHRAPVPTELDPYPEQQQREMQAAAVWRELASDGEGSAPD
ncbi:MAG: hypothetical protein IPJ42_00765 [Betaproteobacteria bacterium]|nr:hypothetical protein [Betaproteobacteria bacterium]MBK7456973.1 hypothetical protein [Betaproteobacteria bacterium]MBK7518295.1 hypothetical protein [Betaproteobacteria bacterium]MBK8104194.1 hypothetical protein [Betaproteobacteria bacterium]